MMHKSIDLSFKKSVHLSLIISFIVLICSVSLVSAVEFGEIQINPNPVWLDSLMGEGSVDLAVECISNSTVDVIATFNENFETKAITMILSENNNESYVFDGSFIVNEFGNHTIDIICVSNNETIDTISSFFVNGLDLEIVSISETEVYGGNYSTLKTSVMLNNDYIVSGSEFTIKLSDASNVWNIDVSEIIVLGDVYILEWDIPNLNRGAYNLELVAYYNNHSIVAQLNEPFIVKPLISIDILEPFTDRVYSFSETEQLEIVVRANTNTFLIDKLYQSQFYAKLDGKKLQVENFTYNTNTKTYHFFVDVYKVNSDDYEYKLFVYIKPDGFSEQKSDAYVDIQFMVPFKLDLKNAKNQPIADSKTVLIKTSDGATYDECVTDTNGVCTAIIYSGTYNLLMDFDDVSVEVYDVELPGESNSGSVENIIKYDNPEDITLFGFKDIQKVFVVTFILPFESARVFIYDIVSDTNTSVLRCDDWDFEQRLCAGEWIDISSMSDYLSNKIIFNTDTLSAFAVGMRDTLSIEMEAINEKVYLGENVELKGIVYGALGDRIDNVTINYNYGGVSGNTVTNKDGIFSFNVKGPMVVGTFKGVIEAKKEPYIFAKSTFNFETYKSELFEIDAKKDIFILKPGRSSIIDLTLRNTGQTIIEDITLTIEGINPAWIDMSPVSIDVLGISKSIGIKVNISIPEYTEDCEMCLDNYLISFSAESEKGLQVSKDIELDMEMDDVVSNGRAKEGLSESVGLFSFSASDSTLNNIFTGFVLVGQENGLSLSIIILILIFVFNKRFIKTPHVTISPLYLDHIRTEVLRLPVASSIDLKNNKSSEGKSIQKKMKAKTKDSKSSKKQDKKSEFNVKNTVSNPFE